jgi:hypothetical protein
MNKSLLNRWLITAVTVACLSGAFSSPVLADALRQREEIT